MKTPSLSTLALLIFSLFCNADTLGFNFNDGDGTVDVNDFAGLVTAGAFTPTSVAHSQGFADMDYPASPRNTKKAFADISRDATDTMSVTLTVGPAATLNISNLAFEFGFDEDNGNNALNPGYTLKYKIDAGAFVTIDTHSLGSHTGTGFYVADRNLDISAVTALQNLSDVTVTFQWDLEDADNRDNVNREWTLDDVVFTGTATGNTPPTIQSFAADAAYTSPGQSVQLSWTTTDADTLSIDQGVGDVTGSTSTSVIAAPPITYTLTATNAYGSTTATAKLFDGVAPNIVFVLADDMGWTDLNSFNQYSSTWYQTPRLATLAGESVRFNNCYAEPVCSPTRADLMTGFYPTRHHMYTVTNPGDTDKQLDRR